MVKIKSIFVLIVPWDAREYVTGTKSQKEDEMSLGTQEIQRDVPHVPST